MLTGRAQEYQKDAILRRMQEYKREKSILESRLEDLEKRSAYHDDHIRITDAWLLQVCLSRSSALSSDRRRLYKK